jgi:DNA-binding XRE family transcriptional regulator
MRAGLSRASLGRMAGISGKQVGLIERGKVPNPHFETVADLANALSKSLNEEVDVRDVFPLKRRFRR